MDHLHITYIAGLTSRGSLDFPLRIIPLLGKNPCLLYLLIDRILRIIPLLALRDNSANTPRVALTLTVHGARFQKDIW